MGLDLVAIRMGTVALCSSTMNSRSGLCAEMAPWGARSFCIGWGVISLPSRVHGRSSEAT